MWLMLNQNRPDDYVIATGESHSVGEFLELAFEYLDLNPYDYVRIDSRYLRPSDPLRLEGDASKAHEELGWRPRVKFKELVRMMVQSDLKVAERERKLRDSGYAVPNSHDS
jgi:GDPmannose 4,6-dehydratase